MVVAEANGIVARALTESGSTDAADRGIALPKLHIVRIRAHIVGVTPLLTNRFSESTQEEIEKKQGGGPKTKKAPRNPDADYKAARHLLTDQGDGQERYGFPAMGIKLAMANAGYRFGDEKSTKTVLGAITIPTRLVEIITPTPPTMNANRVVHGGASKVTSLAYRPEYWPWEMRVPLTFNGDFITEGQVLNLLSLAGLHVGIGAWRIENKGTFGQFDVVGAECII